MTDLSLTTRKPSLFATLFRRLIDWLNEEVATDTPPQFSPRDWADLPIHHAIRDDRGGR